MKEVLILRHADWDTKTGSLTKNGKQHCQERHGKIGTFTRIIASPFDRTQETARLLTDGTPRIDERAGILCMTKAQEKHIEKLRGIHPLGVAGVIFSVPELLPPVQQAGEKLVSLIKETLAELPKNGRALIISHDGTMIAAEKILKKKSFTLLDKTYRGLDGYIVDEQLRVHDFS